MIPTSRTLSNSYFCDDSATPNRAKHRVLGSKRGALFGVETKHEVRHSSYCLQAWSSRYRACATLHATGALAEHRGIAITVSHGYAAGRLGERSTRAFW